VVVCAGISLSRAPGNPPGVPFAGFAVHVEQMQGLRHNQYDDNQDKQPEFHKSIPFAGQKKSGAEISGG
jgi:hypothetical protein